MIPDAMKILCAVLAVVLFTRAEAFADPARWEKEIAGLEAKTRNEAPGGVVLFGSSSFRLWTNAQAAFPEHRIINLGFGGSEYRDLNDFVDRLVIPRSPRVVLLYGGDNDIASGKTPDSIETEARRLVERLRTALPKARIGIFAVKPSPSRAKFLEVQRETNARLRKLAQGERRVDFIDVAKPILNSQGQPDPVYFVQDMLHLNAAGYERWRQVIAPYLHRWDR